MLGGRAHAPRPQLPDWHTPCNAQWPQSCAMPRERARRSLAHHTSAARQRYKAKDEGAAKARLLLLTLALAFGFVVLSYFVPVLYSVPLLYWAGLPAGQAAGFFLNASPAMLGAGFFSGE